MRTPRLLGFAFLLPFCLAGTATAQIFVDADAPCPGDGTSWATAFCTIHAALAVASSGDEIWVAEGVYYPDEGAGQVDDDRSMSFNVALGVSLYGGFGGFETARDQRDPSDRPTVLSGDIDQNDTDADGNHVAETPADIQGTNTFHVVAGVDGILDGFTVTAGQTDGVGDPNFGYGGGILGYPGAPTLFTLRNLIVIGNEAVLGGGVFFYNAVPGSSLTNVTVTGNAAGRGGGVYGLLAALTMTNVTISGNTATGEGGGIYNDEGTLTLLNTTISGNTATTGGGIYNFSLATTALTNGIVWGNTGGNVSAGISTTIDDSVIEGGCPASGATCTNVLTADPNLQALADNGGFVSTRALGAGSSALDAGDDGACPATDARGFDRDADCDIGAFEEGVIEVIATISGNAGWRMLSAPVAGFTAAQLTDDTALQGLPGTPYPGADLNLYTYPASGAWASPSDLDTAWGDGLGFIAYFFDNTDFGSRMLPFTLDAVGTEPEADVDVALGAGGFTLVGNPFGTGFDLDQLAANGELVQAISVWNDAAGADAVHQPSNGSFVLYNIGEGEVVPAWQGFFVESTTATEATFPTAGKTGAGATFGHFSKRAEAMATIPFELHGPEGNLDRAARLYFHETAREGRDAYDATKLEPLLTRYATLAFVQDREGEPYLLSQDARPLALVGEQRYDLAFQNVGLSGDFEVRWPAWEGVPADWRLTFVDRDLGRSVDMRQEDGYAFEAERDVAAGKHAGLFAARAAAQVYDGAARFAVVIETGAATAVEGETPAAFGLEGNYPNPFNPSTVIRYSVAETAPVRLAVYDVLGREVAVLVDGVRAAGRYEAAFDASRLAGGVYVYRLEAGAWSESRAMVLLR